MRSLAMLIMRGRGQAVMATTVLTVLSVLITPLSVFSAAAVALVALRQGAQEGFFVIAASTLATAVLNYLLFSDLTLVFGFAIFVWLPMWLLAMLLRFTRSLATTLEAALLLAVVLLGYLYLLIPDPTQHWLQMLNELLKGVPAESGMDEQQFQEVLGLVAQWMSAVIAAVFFLQMALALFVARWWQAVLYNPGGFGEEFRTLQYHQALAWITAPFLLWYVLGEPPSLALALGALLLAAYFLQGLAVTHSVVRQLKANVGWLAGVYVLLVLAMPYMFMALAMTGFADAWMNIRKSVATSGDDSG
ncbi:MAG: DUF2232 domain-containing protein [Chromatiales bacterium]|jgi:hypothetical protein